MPDSARVEDLIRQSMIRLRADLDLSPLDRIDSETRLLGGDSELDSMAVVHLIVDLEARLEAAFGRNWILADERALSRRHSPFRSVASLRDFILESASGT